MSLWTACVLQMKRLIQRSLRQRTTRHGTMTSVMVLPQCTNLETRFGWIALISRSDCKPSSLIHGLDRLRLNELWAHMRIASNSLPGCVAPILSSRWSNSTPLLQTQSMVVNVLLPHIQRLLTARRSGRPKRSWIVVGSATSCSSKCGSKTHFEQMPNGSLRITWPILNHSLLRSMRSILMPLDVMNGSGPNVQSNDQFDSCHILTLLHCGTIKAVLMQRQTGDLSVGTPLSREGVM